MNLGKLLSAGKSVFGGGANKRYHEDRRVYLPKFNSAKNPFSSKPAEAPAAPAAEPEPTTKPVAARVATQAGGATAAKAPEMPVTAAPRPVRSTNWADKLNPFRSAKPVASPMVDAVQAELSLESVKPIANDLADADIEVVPVKSCTVAPKEPSLIPDTREVWEFAGVRVVKPV